MPKCRRLSVSRPGRKKYRKDKNSEKRTENFVFKKRKCCTLVYRVGGNEIFKYLQRVTKNKKMVYI